MLPNYAPWGGLEAYQMGVALTRKIWVKMGKINKFWGKSVNTLSHECQGGER